MAGVIDVDAAADRIDIKNDLLTIRCHSIRVQQNPRRSGGDIGCAAGCLYDTLATPDGFVEEYPWHLRDCPLNEEAEPMTPRRDRRRAS